MNSMVISILVLFSITISVNAKYTDYEPCDQVDQLIPDPKNCSRFYECTRGGWVGEACNPGLEFNPAILQCDYPQNVKCANQTSKHSFGNEECGDLQLDQLKPDPTNCSQFIQCAPQGLVALPCSIGLLFNPETLQCDYPDNVQCANESIPEYLGNEDCGNLPLDGVKPDTTNCSQFIQCAPEGLVILPCPKTLLFNPDTLQCDFPENVKCANESAQQNLGNPDCGDLAFNAVEPDPNNCSQFIQCAPQGLVTLACPGDLLFNPDTLECDYPENVKCANASSQQTADNEGCGDLPLNELKPDPTDCSQFIECAPQGLVNLSCPTGLYFNPTTKQCDYPANVECEYPKNNTRAGTCNEEDYDRLYPNPSDCSSFLQCSPLGLVPLPCPAPLLFNPEISLCDYPENVECGNETIYTR